MKYWVAILLLFFLFPGLVLAQSEVQVEADPGDNPLNISGRLEDSNSFIGNLRLMAQGGDVATFSFLPSDLKRSEGDERIGRQNISLIGDPTLQANVPKDFQVSITGVEKPGTYEGEIEILLPDQPRDEALTIDLTVIAKAQPNLTPLAGTDQLQLRLVNCNWSLDCAVARRILPKSAFLESRLLQFENPIQADVRVTDVEVVVFGEKTGYQLTEVELVLPEEEPTIPAAQISALPLELDITNIPPDHYTGAIYLTLGDENVRLTLPVDLNVRIGPFWPLVALLLGIVLGRLIKYMQERGQPQSEALTAVYETAVQIKSAHPEDQIVLQPMLDEVRQLVYRERLETVREQLQAIENRLIALQRLRQMEEALQGKEQHPDAQRALAMISQARQLIGRKEDEKAKTVIAEVEKILGTLKTSLMSDGQEDPDIKSAQSRAGEAVVALDQAAQVTAKTVPEKSWQRRLWDWLTSVFKLSGAVRAETTLWVIRPLLYLALLAGLLAVGLNSLYVDKGLTFGANPFADYLALILWGLTADVASRSLSNLSPGQSS